MYRLVLFAMSVFAAPRLRGSHQQRLTPSVSPGDLIPDSVTPYEPPIETSLDPSPESYPKISPIDTPSLPISIADSSHPDIPHQYLLPTPYPKLPPNMIPPMPPAYMLPYHKNHQPLLLPTPNPRPQVPSLHVSIPIYNLTGAFNPDPQRPNTINPTYQNNTDIITDTTTDTTTDTITDCLMLSIPQSAALPPCGKYQVTGREEL